jgi:hypothetical protein
LRTDRVSFTFGGSGRNHNSSNNNNNNSAVSLAAAGRSTSDESSNNHNNHNNHKTAAAAAGFWKISAQAQEFATQSMSTAVTRASTTRGSGSHSSTTTSTPGGAAGSHNSSIPCTEKEMKALMSMFVEIMGLSLNTEKLNALSKKQRAATSSRSPSHNNSSNNKGLFRFPQDIPAPPGGWPTDLVWPSMDANDGDDKEEHVEDEDSLPDLEDIPPEDREPADDTKEEATAEANRQQPQQQPQQQPASSTTPERLTTYSKIPVGFVAGIAVPEWEALERVAMEDALEQEERARKAAASAAASSGKQGKRTSPRLTIPPSTTTNPIDKRQSEREWQREQEKLITQWRQQVVSACQSNDASLLQVELEGAPLPTLSNKSNDEEGVTETVIQQCWLELAPHCLPKNRQSMEKGKECRFLLLNRILKSAPPQVLTTPLRNGRSVLHSACFYGDVDFVGLILQHASAFENLAKTCEESGWTPLHYAAVSGSVRTTQQLLLKEEAALAEKVTNDMHTWIKATGKGLSVEQLLQNLIHESPQKKVEMETHGMAVAELRKDMMHSKSSSSRYLQWLEQLLAHLQTGKLKSLTDAELKTMDDILVEDEPSKGEADDETLGKSEKSDSTQSNKKKKKKKKKAKQAEKTAAIPIAKQEPLLKPPTPTPTPIPAASSRDPLVSLLEGMGFEEGPIVKGIAACGGSDRATADTVIAWMLETNQTNDPDPVETTPLETTPNTDFVEAETPTRKSNLGSFTQKIEPENPDPSDSTDGERLAAERLANKREERRQRNREWNKKQEAQRTVPPPSAPSVPKQQPVPALTGTSSLSGRTVEFSHDAVTVASSVGDYGNDDLTVSTIGSRNTITQPTPSPAPSAPTPIQLYGTGAAPPLVQNTPPGFGSLVGGVAGGQLAEDVAASREPWKAAVPLQHYAAPLGLNHHLYSGLPPGIPETHPVGEDRARLPNNTAAALGGFQSPMGVPHVPFGVTHMPPPHQIRGVPFDSFSAPPVGYGGGGESFFAPPVSNAGSYMGAMGVGGGGLPGRMGSVPVTGGGLPVGRLPGHGGGASGLVLGNHGTPVGLVHGGGLQPMVPSLSQTSSFGFPSRSVDSSMIESISTGAGDIGGASLWGSAHVLPTTTSSGGGADASSSSLLRHLINDTGDRASNESSLFGEIGKEDESRRQRHSIW